MGTRCTSCPFNLSSNQYKFRTSYRKPPHGTLTPLLTHAYSNLDRTFDELLATVERHSPGGTFETRPLGPIHLTALFKQAAWLDRGRPQAADGGLADPAAGHGNRGGWGTETGLMEGGRGGGGAARGRMSGDVLLERLQTRLMQVRGQGRQVVSWIAQPPSRPMLLRSCPKWTPAGCHR